MRTTGKGLYKWMKEQENVHWPKMGGGLMVYFRYKGVDCCGVITKFYSGSKLVRTDLTIRPMQSIHDIGNGAGSSVVITFKKDANKKQ